LRGDLKFEDVVMIFVFAVAFAGMMLVDMATVEVVGGSAQGQEYQ
jgi:hypothetical protein